jgi:hypothetical protein
MVPSLSPGHLHLGQNQSTAVSPSYKPLHLNLNADLTDPFPKTWLLAEISRGMAVAPEQFVCSCLLRRWSKVLVRGKTGLALYACTTQDPNLVPTLSTGGKLGGRWAHLISIGMRLHTPTLLSKILHNRPGLMRGELLPHVANWL